MDEIYQRFVIEAPFRMEREKIWTAFGLWAELVWKLFPESPMWLDGGFVTHKSWAAPADIDVLVTTKPSLYNAVMTRTLDGQLWTDPGSDKTQRVQPMGGYVDGFVLLRGADDPRYWNSLWSTVTGPDRLQIPGAVKGYLEVRKP